MASRHDHSWVLRDSFPQHFPLPTTFFLESHSALKSDWKLSRPLNPEQREYLRQQNVDDAFRAEAIRRYGSMEAFPECSLFKQDSFHAISNLVELSWRQILGGANHNLRLKPSQMGCSKHPSIKKQHRQMSSSLGRVGDYSATCEATSVHSKQVVRRLQCVIRTRTKFQDDHMPDVQHQTVRIDQECIISAKGFGVSYLEWAERKGLPALNLPDLICAQHSFISMRYRHLQMRAANGKTLTKTRHGKICWQNPFRVKVEGWLSDFSHAHVKKALELVPVRQKMKGPLGRRSSSAQ